MYDDPLSGANGSIRRFIGAIARRGGESTLDSSATGASGISHAFDAAQNAPYGSIASRDDPNRYGSVASRMYPGIFGPEGAANPAFQQQQQASAQTDQMRRAVGDQDLSAQRQAYYNANALTPLITSLMSSTQRRPVSGINVSSPYPSRLSDDDSSDLEQSR